VTLDAPHGRGWRRGRLRGKLCAERLEKVGGELGHEPKRRIPQPVETAPRKLQGESVTQHPVRHLATEGVRWHRLPRCHLQRAPRCLHEGERHIAGGLVEARAVARCLVVVVVVGVEQGEGRR
jgi:hypothetical protein